MSSPSETSNPPTLVGQLLLCTAAAWATRRLYAYGQQGSEAASIGWMLTALIALLAAVRAFNALDTLVDRWRRHRQLEAFADGQGDATLGDERDAKKAGLLGRHGIILGRLGKKTVRYAGEASMIVAGRPGSWKGVAFVLLNLLLAPKPTKKKFQSYIVTDISGELYAVSSRRLRELGYNVIALAPEGERLSQELGVPIKTVQHNPAGYLDPRSPNLVEDVATFVQLLHPGTEPSKQNGSTQHFDDLGRTVLTTFVLWLLDKYGYITLPALRRCVMSSHEEMLSILELASESDSFGRALSEYASTVLSLMGNSREEFSGALTTATRSITLFNTEGPIGHQVSEHHFDWGMLKEEPTVVFIIVPPERLKSQAQYLNLTISTAAEALARHRSNQRVIFLLDEIGNLFVPNIIQIVSLYRKFGLQVIFVLQQLESQLSRVYGREAAREIQANCEVIMALSTTDLVDLKRLSELAGQETAPDGSHTIREGAGGAPETSYTGSYRGRPVLRSEAIRLLEKDKALVFYANAPPMIVDLINYLHDPKLRALADENPYYRKK